MTFADWLAKKKIGPVEAAAALDCTRETVWRLSKRYTRPSPELAGRIVKWTGGKVGLADLMDVDPARPRRLKQPDGANAGRLKGGRK